MIVILKTDYTIWTLENLCYKHSLPYLTCCVGCTPQAGQWGWRRPNTRQSWWGRARYVESHAVLWHVVLYPAGVITESLIVSEAAENKTTFFKRTSQNDVLKNRWLGKTTTKILSILSVLSVLLSILSILSVLSAYYPIVIGRWHVWLCQYVTVSFSI